MGERNRLFFLTMIMTAVSLSSVVVTILILYRTAFEQTRERLVETAQSQARLIEAVARFDSIYSRGTYPGGAAEATLRQITDAHENYKGFGETGEFTLARRDGDRILFLLRHRHVSTYEPEPIPFSSELAEPMRRALSGRSGTVVGPDYRGITVLAAHEPVAELDLGIVAKIDLTEIRAPFVRAAVVACCSGLLAVLAGALLFVRIINPLIRRLGEREQQYRSLITNIPYVTWTSDTTGNTIFISPNVEQVYGYTPEEIYEAGDKLWLGRIHPGDVEKVREAFERLIQKKGDFDIEYRIRRRDDQWIWLHDKAIFTYEKNGVLYADGVFADITERKNAEMALQNSEEKFRTLADASLVGVFIFQDMKFRYLNPVGARMFGWKAEELIDKKGPIDLTHPQDRPASENYIRMCLVGQAESPVFSFRGIHRSRGIIHCEVVGRAVNLAGKPAVIGTVIDVTERVQAQENLLMEKDYLINILNSMKDGVAIVNQQGDVEYANPALIREFGPFEGRKCHLYLHERKQPCSWCNRHKGMLDDNRTRKEWHSDKSGKTYDVVESTIRRSDGSVSKLVTLRDISERKKAEEELKIAHAEMENRVEKRTAELAGANEELKREVNDRKRAEGALREAFSEIKQLKDRLQTENLYLREQIEIEHNFDEIIGQSNALRQVLSKIEQVGSTDTTTLILGETGTGKELIARAIHNASPRKDRPLVKVDCTTLAPSIIESELFGHQKGAFTGAQNTRVGRFELANGTTLFLDEIGDLPKDLQAKLLRILQEGEFERLGSARAIKVDVRVIAATNRNLQEEVRNGKFREDLWYRLNVFPIIVPPLRQRREDIPQLVNWFVAKYSKRLGKQITTMSRRDMKALREYSWPGNVRELEHLIERAVITSQGSVLRVEIPKVPDCSSVNGNGIRALEDVERDHIFKVLKESGWKIEGHNGAAQVLGLNPGTLRSRMKKLGIQRSTG